jgi:hypothetical protein
VIALFEKPLGDAWSDQEEKTPVARKRKLLIGTILFGLALPVELAQDYGRPPFGSYTHVAVLALMLAGTGFFAWSLWTKD